MASRSKLTTGLLAFVMFVTGTCASTAEVGLIGPERNVFVESSFQTCFKEARGDPANKATDVAIIAQYCVCYSNQMADRLINDDLKTLDAAVATDSAALHAKLQPLIKTSAETCIAKLRK
jgi:hypothetical protein